MSALRTAHAGALRECEALGNSAESFEKVSDDWQETCKQWRKLSVFASRWKSYVDDLHRSLAKAGYTPALPYLEEMRGNFHQFKAQAAEHINANLPPRKGGSK